MDITEEYLMKNIEESIKIKKAKSVLLIIADIFCGFSFCILIIFTLTKILNKQIFTNIKFHFFTNTNDGFIKIIFLIFLILNINLSSHSLSKKHIQALHNINNILQKKIDKIYQENQKIKTIFHNIEPLIYLTNK